MIGLVLDFESTGLDVENDRIIEVAAIRYDFHQSSIIDSFSQLVNPNLELQDKIIELTDITPKALQRHGYSTNAVLSRLALWADKSDFIVAHNGTNFDAKILYAELIRSCSEVEVAMFNKTWIDTCVHVKYPEHITTRKLSYLAFEHNIVNSMAHRALADVLTTTLLLSHYDINDVLKSAKQKCYLVVANVTFQDKSKAVESGFRWRADVKQWQKVILEFELYETLKNCDFTTTKTEIIPIFSEND